MKTLIFLLLIIIGFTSQGQESESTILGSWILFNRTYKFGEELPEELKLTESYIDLILKIMAKFLKHLTPLKMVLFLIIPFQEIMSKLGQINIKLKCCLKIL